MVLAAVTMALQRRIIVDFGRRIGSELGLNVDLNRRRSRRLATRQCRNTRTLNCRCWSCAPLVFFEFSEHFVDARLHERILREIGFETAAAEHTLTHGLVGRHVAGTEL